MGWQELPDQDARTELKFRLNDPGASVVRLVIAERAIRDFNRAHSRELLEDRELVSRLLMFVTGRGLPHTLVDGQAFTIGEHELDAFWSEAARMRVEVLDSDVRIPAAENGSWEFSAELWNDVGYRQSIRHEISGAELNELFRQAMLRPLDHSRGVASQFADLRRHWNLVKARLEQHVAVSLGRY